MLAAGLVATAAVSSWSFVAPGQAPTAPAQHSSSAVDFQPLTVAEYEAASAPEETVAAEGAFRQALRWIGGGLAAGVLAATLSAPANAGMAIDGSNGLTPLNDRGVPKFDRATRTIDFRASAPLEFCKSNKKFAKIIKDELYSIQQKQKKYPAGSVVYNRYNEKLKLVKQRSKAYGDRLCGAKDGRPRTMVNPTIVRGGLLVPSLMFLYTAGWIGWTGRSYLQRTRSVDKEIVIDVPLAAVCMASGFAWPVNAWQEIVNGEMVEKDENLWTPEGAF